MTEILRQSRLIRRLLFLCVTSLPLLLLFWLVVLPVQQFFADRDAEIQRSSEMLARLSAIASYDFNKLSTDEALAATKDEYIQAASPGLAHAKLQAQLKIMSESSGARLRSVQALSPETQASLTYIGAKLSVFGPIQSVQRTLQTIEGAKPYLFVTNAVLRLAPQSALPGNAAEPIIDAELDVLGAFQQEASQ